MKIDAHYDGEDVVFRVGERNLQVMLLEFGEEAHLIENEAAAEAFVSLLRDVANRVEDLVTLSHFNDAMDKRDA